MKAGDLAIAAGKAVEAVEAALEAEIDGEIRIESFLEPGERDVVARANLHPLPSRLLRNLQERRELVPEPLEALLDPGVEPLADLREPYAERREARPLAPGQDRELMSGDRFPSAQKAP